MTGEEMYELLKQRDNEITRLREALKAFEVIYIELAAELASNRERETAQAEIGRLQYEHGLRSGWTLR